MKNNIEQILGLVDCVEKAFILGWCVGERFSFASLSEPDSTLLSLLDKYNLDHHKDDIQLEVNNRAPLFGRNESDLRFYKEVQKICWVESDCCYEYSSSCELFDNLKEEFKKHFVFGYCCVTSDLGSIFSIDSSLSVLFYYNDNLAQKFIDYLKLPKNSFGKKFDGATSFITLQDSDVLDFLDCLVTCYDSRNSTSTERNIYSRYAALCSRVDGLNSNLSRDFGKPLELEWCKTLPEGVAPYKARGSDGGFDLTLVKFEEIKWIKQVGQNEFVALEIYDTGISVKPPFGWQFDLRLRSSGPKYGYVLANAPGTIDRSYRGSIKVALVKVNPEAKPLSEQLPARIVQLVPTPVVHMVTTEKQSFDGTSRGDKGFGSTGK